MAQALYTGYVRGRLGRYAATLFSDGEQIGKAATISPLSAFTGTGTIVSLLEAPVIRYARLDVAYGDALMASYCSLTFSDEAGTILANFQQPFDEKDFLVRITGPSKDGTGTMSWWGRVRRASQSRPLARRSLRRSVTLDVYCALGSLKDVPGEPAAAVPLGWLIALNLFRANPHLTAYFHNDLWPDNIVSQSVQFIRIDDALAQEPEGDAASGDYGTKRGQIEAWVSWFGLKVWQALDGSWRVWHRAGIGEEQTAETASRVGTTTAWDSEVVALDEYENLVFKGEEEDVVDTLPAVGSILLQSSQQVSLVTDGCFDDWTGTYPTSTPDHWQTSGNVYEQSGAGSAACAGAAQLGFPSTLSGAVEQDLLSVAATPDVRVRGALQISGFLSQVVSVELTLLGAVDTYYLNNSGTWTTTPSTIDFTAPPAGAWSTSAFVSSTDFPEAGLLHLKLSSDFGPYITGVSLLLEDNLGAPITDFIVEYGTGEGVRLEIEAAPDMDADEDGAGDWQDALSFSSSRYGSSYASVGLYQVADRLAQSPDLDVIDSVVRGLYGPETRLFYDTDDDGFDEAFIAAGLELHLLEGETRGVWVQMPDARLTDDGAPGSGGS